MLKIGITGGIASGKSTVAQLFSSLNVPVIDADEISHRLSEPGTVCFNQIVQQFGEGFVDYDGNLDRKKLAEYVFKSREAKNKLEEILHPAIKQAMQDEIKTLDDFPYVLLVIPLLIETSFNDIVDRVLVINVTREEQIDRLKQRSNMNETLINQIIDSQADPQMRLQIADDIIDNHDDISRLKPLVEALHSKYLAIAASK